MRPLLFSLRRAGPNCGRSFRALQPRPSGLWGRRQKGLEGEKREGKAEGGAHPHAVEFTCGRLEPPPFNTVLVKNPNLHLLRGDFGVLQEHHDGERGWKKWRAPDRQLKAASAAADVVCGRESAMGSTGKTRRTRGQPLRMCACGIESGEDGQRTPDYVLKRKGVLEPD